MNMYYVDRGKGSRPFSKDTKRPVINAVRTDYLAVGLTPVLVDPYKA